MKKPLMLRDVMNSKSTYHCRHSENYFNIKSISKYYAIESRIFNSIFDNEKNKYVKGPLWFTNIMVFDFDFDESHFPNIKNYDEKLKSSLSILEKLLGKPHYIIYNKKDFTEFQIKNYFTKCNIDGSTYTNLPKQFGCQVIYELKDSIKSQYHEVLTLYNNLRNKINQLTCADLNFKGHMFKNFYNKDLFDIIENQDYDKIDIFELSHEICETPKNLIDKIKNLKPFEKLSDNNKMPNCFKLYSSKLFNYYINLNSWKSNDCKVNYRNKKAYLNQNLNNIKNFSRNETLFNYLRNLPDNLIEDLNYKDLLNSGLFEHCNIIDPIPENEFNSTKQSVLLYKKKFNCEIENEESLLIDNRVFKCKQKNLNLDFFNEIKEKLDESFKLINNKKFYTNWNSRKLLIEFYNNKNDDSQILADIFLASDVDKILSNIRSLFTPNFVNWINKYFNNKYGLYDLYKLIESSIYFTHFKYYRSIQKLRTEKIEKPIKNNKNNFRKKILDNWGFSFKGNILKFKKYYNKLKIEGLLKENGCSKPISFYQNHFHIRNSEASKLSFLIKKYLIAIKRISIYKKLKKNKVCFLKNFYKNTSGLFYCLINIFNIFYSKLFIIKDKKIIILYIFIHT